MARATARARLLTIFADSGNLASSAWLRKSAALVPDWLMLSGPSFE
jgi:hypothetical protein